MLLAGMMFYFVYQVSWLIAGAIFWLAVLSDMLDGFLARKLNAVSSLGGLFDHGSDAILSPCPSPL